MSEFESIPTVVAFHGFFAGETEDLVDAKQEAGVWVAEVIRETFAEALELMSPEHIIGRLAIVAHTTQAKTVEDAIRILGDRDFTVTVDQEIALPTPERGDDAGALLVGRWTGWVKPLEKDHAQHTRFVQMLASMLLSRRDVAAGLEMDKPGRRAEYHLHLETGVIQEIKHGQA